MFSIKAEESANFSLVLIVNRVIIWMLVLFIFRYCSVSILCFSLLHLLECSILVFYSFCRPPFFLRPTHLCLIDMRRSKWFVDKTFTSVRYVCYTQHVHFATTKLNFSRQYIWWWAAKSRNVDELNSVFGFDIWYVCWFVCSFFVNLIFDVNMPHK